MLTVNVVLPYLFSDTLVSSIKSREKQTKLLSLGMLFLCKTNFTEQSDMS